MSRYTRVIDTIWLGFSEYNYIILASIDTAPPNISQNVQAPTEFIQSTSMLLTWQSPTTDNSSQSISYYQVTCDPGAYTYTPSNTSQWVTDLQPYTKYNCCVSAFGTTCNVTGEMSGDCINITTLEAGLYN